MWINSCPTMNTLCAAPTRTAAMSTPSPRPRSPATRICQSAKTSVGGQSTAQSHSGSLYQMSARSRVLFGSRFRLSIPNNGSMVLASVARSNGASIHQPPCRAALTINGKIASGRKNGMARQTDGRSAAPGTPTPDTSDSALPSATTNPPITRAVGASGRGTRHRFGRVRRTLPSAPPSPPASRRSDRPGGASTVGAR